MGWDKTGRYYQRSVRKGSQVVSEYGGSGEMGRLQALADALLREQRQQRQEELRLAKSATTIDAERVQEALKEATRMANATMLAAGYHRPKRQWKRKRVKPMANMNDAGTKRFSNGAVVPRSTDEFAVIFQAAEKGDRSALESVRTVLKCIPEVANALGGNLAREAQRSLIHSAVGSNPAMQATVQAKLEGLAAELVGSEPTAIERLLVEAALVAYLHTYGLELKLQQDLNVEVAKYYQRALTQAQARYLRALRVLSTVQRLAIPVLRQTQP